MKNYTFKPPSKYKLIYIFINIAIIIATITIWFIYRSIVLVGIPLCVLLLYNGLWSVNKNWYSLCHRKDKSYSIQYVWIMFIILGSTLLVLELLYFLL